MPGKNVKVNHRNFVRVKHEKYIPVKGGAVPLLLDKIHKWPIMRGSGVNANQMVGMAPSNSRTVIPSETHGGAILDLSRNKINTIQFSRNRKGGFKESPIEFKF